MRALGSTFAALLILAGCRTPDSAQPAGVVPASYNVSRAEPGDGPASIRPKRSPPIRQAAYRPPSAPIALGAPRPFPPAPRAGRGQGHAADYRWLTGSLERDPDSGTWSIRYAPPGTDAHGGLMELVAPGPMPGWNPGDLVRVEGTLVDPAPLQVRPGYRPACMQALPR